PKGFGSFIMQLDVTTSNNGRKQFLLNVSSQNRRFVKSIHDDKNEAKWQEITSTNTRQWLGTLGNESSGYNSVLDLPPGLYECSIPPDAFEVDAPLDPNGSGYIATIDVYEGRDKRKVLRFISSYRNLEYHGTIHTKNDDNPNGNFRGWKRIMDAEEFESMNDDTGWIEWETKGTTTKRETDKPEALQNTYRVVKTNGVKNAYLRVNVNNIQTQTVIGSIPKEHTPKNQNFYLRTPISMNPAVLSIDETGDLWIYLNKNDEDKWKPSDYIKGEVTWIIDDKGVGV